MLIPNQLVEVKVIGVTLNHYRSLGYDVNMFDTIMVPPETPGITLAIPTAIPPIIFLNITFLLHI